MILVGEGILRAAAEKHPTVVAWLDAWATVVRDADWANLAVVYPSADGVKADSGRIVTVFNVRGNRYRLLTFVTYATRTVRVLALLSHAQYSRNRWRKKL